MPNPENLLPPFDSERGRECQKKSVESRRRNKERRENMQAIARAIVYSEVKNPSHLAAIEKNGLPVSDDPNYGEFAIATAIMRTIQKGTVDDLLKLQALLGEDTARADPSQETALATLIGAIKESGNDAETAIAETGGDPALDPNG